MNSEHFYPKPHAPQFDATSDFKVRYEGLKSAFKADILASETCFSKCNLDLQQAALSDKERNCLRQCNIKYFDSSLVIENEMTNFVKGMPMWGAILDGLITRKAATLALLIY